MGTNIRIKLEMSGDAYKCLARTIKGHRDMLYKLKINDGLKEDLVRDMRIIISIIQNAEVRPSNKGSSGAGTTDAVNLSLHSTGMGHKKEEG
jgi:hypothetical protein